MIWFFAGLVTGAALVVALCMWVNEPDDEPRPPQYGDEL